MRLTIRYRYRYNPPRFSPSCVTIFCCGHQPYWHRYRSWMKRCDILYRTVSRIRSVSSREMRHCDFELQIWYQIKSKCSIDRVLGLWACMDLFWIKVNFECIDTAQVPDLSLELEPLHPKSRCAIIHPRFIDLVKDLILFRAFCK